MLLGLLGDMGGEFRRQQLKSGNMLTAEAHTGTKYFPPHAIFPSFFLEPKLPFLQLELGAHHVVELTMANPARVSCA